MCAVESLLGGQCLSMAAYVMVMGPGRGDRWPRTATAGPRTGDRRRRTVHVAFALTTVAVRLNPLPLPGQVWQHRRRRARTTVLSSGDIL